MTKVTVPIPALIGGVSTQPEPLRLPQQAELSNNAVASVVEGLIKRAPTEFQSTFIGFPATPAVVHPIHGNDGDYVVAAADGDLAIFDMADPGGSRVVLRNSAGGIATSADLTYLETDDPQADLKFLTLDDVTLILNRSKGTGATGSLAPPQANAALVHIQSGAYTTQYRVKVRHSGGDNIEVIYRTYATDGSDPNGSPGTVSAAEDSIRTEKIAEVISDVLAGGSTATTYIGATVASGLSSGLPSASWDVSVSGSIIRIHRLDNTDFDIEVSDSQGNSLIQSVYKTVQLFSDLPVHAPVGFRVEVVGDPGTPDSSYWAEFEAHDDTAVRAFADGFWRESVDPLSEGRPNPVLMPHALIRQADGEFRFTPLNGASYPLSGYPGPLENEEWPVPLWATRLAGDTDTNVNPAFFGGPIRDMTYHGGRLCFLSADALTMSETREPFNFYKTTVVDSLDTERIILDTSNIHGDQLSHVVPLGSDLVLFADGMQFIIRSEGPVTPSSTSMIIGGRYNSNPDAQPIQVGDALFVATDRSGYGAIHEFRVTGERRPQLERKDLTAAASDYVGQVRTMTSTPQLNMVAAVSDDEQSVWVYTYYDRDGERVQQAWQKWTFARSPTIIHCWFDDTNLWLILKYGSLTRLMKMRCAPFTRDPGGERIYLDERVDQSATLRLLVGDTTVVSLPFFTDNNVRVVEKSTGKEIRVVSVSDQLVVLAGDHTATEFYLGQPIDFRHDLSYVQRFDENQSPILGEELHLGRAYMAYDNSGPFYVSVVTQTGEEFITRFSGPTLGRGSNYQKIRPISGTFQFPIRGRSDERRISIRSSDPWPLRLVSMDIEARIRRMHGGRA